MLRAEGKEGLLITVGVSPDNESLAFRQADQPEEPVAASATQDES